MLRPGGRGLFIDVVSPAWGCSTPISRRWKCCAIPLTCGTIRLAEWETALAAAGFVTHATRRHRLRMEFASWVARMRTPDVMVSAIRALQAAVAEPVRRHFAIEADGSFMIDVATFEVVRTY